MKRIFSIRLLTVDIGGYTFSPGLVMTLLTLLLAYIMFSLGQWQLSRAQYKDNLQQKIVERKELQPVSYNQLPADDEERFFLPVILKGRFDSSHSILLDNRVVDGVVGYELFSPFIMNNGISILVNRGFVPLGRSRQVLPELHTPEGELIIQGLLEKVPSRAVILAGGLHKGDSWPKVFQYLDLDELNEKLNIEFMGQVLRLAEGQPGGYKYYQPVLNLNSARNSGYAFQWFAMMTAILIIYLVVNTKKRTKEL